jgi:virginiamycin B lyase
LFTEWGTNRIGRLTTTGELLELPLPSPHSEPHGITTAPDGTVWAALETGAVARVAP